MDWWNAYLSYKKKEEANASVDDFVNNFGNYEEGIYKYNGKQWIKQ